MTERPNVYIILTRRAMERLRAPLNWATATIVGPHPDGTYTAENIVSDGMRVGGGITIGTPDGAIEVTS